MSGNSKIEWTDSTWNPVTGCAKLSPGCKYCYAEVFAERFRGVANHAYEQGFDLRLWSERLDLPLKWKKPRRIFVNSMSDLFHKNVPDEFINKVFETMRNAFHHQFQVLTKRPERMFAYMKSWDKKNGPTAEKCPHIWLGTSVELAGYIGRAQIVSKLPSAVRFLSCEPLLGPLDLSEVFSSKNRKTRNNGINWVIVGGESGPRSRPMKEEWVTDIRNQCRRAQVPFFFKQWGGRNKKQAGRLLENRTWDECPPAPLI